MSNILDILRWRYATKRFDSDKKLTNEQVEILKESIRLTPSSYGLQPLHFILVEDKSIRDQLTDAAFGQQQVKDASHLLVFCSHKNITPEQIDAHVQNTAEIRSIEHSTMTKYSDFLKREISSLTSHEKEIWNQKQCYIALGQFLAVCATMEIDAIPMEGFDASKFDEILNLNGRGLHATLVCPIGFRHPEDRHQFNAKVRKSQEVIFDTV
jgi:nitroreductase/dihydropteridine reductase